MALNLPDVRSFGTFLNSGHQVTLGVRMRITAFRILGDYISITVRSCLHRTALSTPYRSSIWHVRGKNSPTAAAMVNKRRQPHGFMQNILNIPDEQNGLTDFSSRMMLQNILYASFGKVKILEQRLPCGTSSIFWFQ